MNDCTNCKSKINDGNLIGCTNCGATFCPDCANKTKRICPNCYHNLEYIG